MTLLYSCVVEAGLDLMVIRARQVRHRLLTMLLTLPLELNVVKLCDEKKSPVNLVIEGSQL